MRKAKEYAKIFNDNPTDKILLEITQSFIRETADLIDRRRCTTYPGILSIFEEQENKWKAFTRRCDSEFLKEDGYRNIIREVYPEAHVIWETAEIAKNIMIKI